MKKEKMSNKNLILIISVALFLMIATIVVLVIDFKESEEGLFLEKDILEVSENYVRESYQFQEYQGYNLKLVSIYPTMECDYCFEVVYSFEVLNKESLPNEVESFLFTFNMETDSIAEVKIEEIVDEKEEKNYCYERNEICITLYDPVIGFFEDGSYNLYGNSCEACSDDRVVYWGKD